MATPTTAPSTTITTRTSTAASSSVRSTVRTAGKLLRGLAFGLSGGVGVENEALSTTSSTPPIITTPATVTWFAYNTGVMANGVRDRISPELIYFYHSFGFASQYYHQDQMFQAAAPQVPAGGRALRRLLRHGDLSPDGRAADRIQPADRTDPSLRPLQAGGFAGAWEVLFRVDRMAVGESAFTAGLANNTGTDQSIEPRGHETTLGINWYLTKWVRAQLNWEHANFASPVQIGNVAHAVYARRRVVHAVPGHLLIIETVPRAALGRRGLSVPAGRAGAGVGGEERRFSFSPPPAATIIPSLVPNFIFRGARLAAQISSRPTSCSGR